ncbi:hypothetical protein [Stakelama saccharophila]|uniref:DUF2946 domain-containing protein n=1 Tax=Stakelama saccharophila TaxID=3075605 RepID=A0ABZ0BB22_9SPHN|nr:hypothetical protein [Stakelama sp. W311]WNO54053.1 hypothetical protein RPR59_01995 [Stakelama sp. W311]
MTAWIRESKATRGIFVAAALLVLLLRILVPSGFMPVETDGKIVIQLCSGYGPAGIADLGKKKPTDQHKGSRHPCAFAGGFAGSLLPPILPPAAVLPLPTVLLSFGSALADLTVHRLAAPPPPAIGPPLNI